MRYQKKKLFVDMDGTIAELRTKEEYDAGVNFSELPPYDEVLTAVKEIVELYNDEIEVYILSAYEKGNREALRQKNQWLDRWLPEVKHRVFVHCGDSKADAFAGIDSDCFLLDDYNVNLKEWEEKSGTAIKLVNGVNSVSCVKNCVHKDTDADAIVCGILEAMNYLDDCVA